MVANLSFEQEPEQWLADHPAIADRIGTELAGLGLNGEPLNSGILLQAAERTVARARQALASALDQGDAGHLQSLRTQGLQSCFRPGSLDYVRLMMGGANFDGRHRDYSEGLVIADSKTEEVFAKAALAAPVPTKPPILITGETGTGKEILARAIHAMSRDSRGPYCAVNCTAIPEELVESELFGYEKGAFTGALGRPKPGRFETSNGGTLFLDEIADMSPATQAKVLRVVEYRRYIPVGGVREKEWSGRLVAATNRNLPELAGRGRFREDLFYRLNVFPVIFPPLRERPLDILPLARHFLRRFGAELNKIWTLAPSAEEQLRNHAWPGNVRELRNTIERTGIFNSGVLAPNASGEIKEIKFDDAPVITGHGAGMLTLAEYIGLVFHQCERDSRQAAVALDVGKAWLEKRLASYGILEGIHPKERP